MRQPVRHDKDLAWERLYTQTSEQLGLQARVRKVLVSAILSGLLPPGSAVPSSRYLSQLLGVARNTVIIAYQELISQGYIVSKDRSGHLVNEQVGLLKPQSTTPFSPKPEEQLNWSPRLKIRPSLQRNINKVADWQKRSYPFVYGQFDPRYFPVAEWRECCRKALSILDIKMWAQDLISADDPDLITAIQQHILPSRGIIAETQEIVITLGAQHALYSLADLLIDSKTVIGIEDPGYPDARNIFLNKSELVVPIPVDEQGMVLDERLQYCDYVFVTPNCQCPTGYIMSTERRLQLLQLAQQYNFVIIEDDFEVGERSDERALPSLKSLDTHGRVIYIGSLSKAFAPGLRIGYVLAPFGFIQELRALRRLMIRHAPTFMQRAFAIFVSLGHYHTLLRRQLGVLNKRDSILREALHTYLPDWIVISPTGGSFCWVQLPQHLNLDSVIETALEHSIVLERGDVFFYEHAPANYIRFGLGSIDSERIQQGIQKLASLVTSLSKRIKN